MTLLLLFSGLARAEEVTIGSLVGAGDNPFLPMNSLYKYSYTQQIYTAEEIGVMGNINSITMWLYGASDLRQMSFDIFMLEVDKDAFERTNDWVTVTPANKVYSGTVTVHNTEPQAYTFVLPTPFAYSGSGNLLIAFNNTTGNWKAGLNGMVFGASSDPKRAIYARQDANAYNPYNPAFAGTDIIPERNVVTLNFASATPIPFCEIIVTANPSEGGTVSGGGNYKHGRSCTITAAPAVGYEFDNWTKDNQVVSTDSLYTFTVTQDVQFVANFQIKAPELSLDPDTIKLGNRPAGAWMRPYTVTLSNANTAGAAQITNLQFQGTGSDALGVDLGNLAIPFTLNHGASQTFDVTWGEQAATMNGTLKVEYQNAVYSGYETFQATATVYVPVAGDVWENAIEVTPPFTGTVNAASLHNNYLMPPTRVPDAADAVYKLVFEEDTYLTAIITNGDDGKMALYQEGFQGLGGPDLANNYTGPASATNNQSRGGNRDIVEIGNGGTANNTYLPGYNYYNYSLTQQIYTADEITTAGTITSLAFKNTGTEKTRTYNIYMLHTEKEIFTSGSDWVAMSDNDLVFSGEITFTVGEWTTIELNTPFVYDGISNLIIGVSDVSGTYSIAPHMACLVFDATSQAIRAYRDNLPYNVSDPDVTGYVMNVKNQIQLDITSPMDPGIYDMTVIPGTYYLVASSTSNTFGVSIETGTLTCPDVVSNPIPANGAMDVDVNTQLGWSLGARTTEYCLRFGTDPNNLETVVDWTRELKQQCSFVNGLNYHTTYYWQVCERNDACPEGVEGPVWSFTTTLNAPTDLVSTQGNYLLEGETLHLVWKAPAEHRETFTYNVYKMTGSTYELLGNTTDTLYNVAGLENTSSNSNHTTYSYVVRAVYSQGESVNSNVCSINMYSTGAVNGHVYEQNGTTPVVGAEANFKVGTRVFSFTTNTLGAYSGTLAANTYDASSIYASAEGYSDTYYNTTVDVTAGGTVNDVNFFMDEFYYPASQVAADYYPNTNNYESDTVQVTWAPPVQRNGDGGNRSLQYYRVYRTVYDNNGPFNPENTVLIADNVTGTNLSAVDPSFGDLDDGIYKYGVGCVYTGNREGGQPGSDTYTFEDGLIPDDWVNDATYPWVVVSPTDYPGYHGNYCIMSGNSGVDNSTSTLQVTMTFIASGSISFLGGCWGESNTATIYDKCQFFVDGVLKFSYGALDAWATYTYNVEAGVHIFKWVYEKDNTINPTGDAFFVDDITFTGVEVLQTERESEIVWSNAMDRGQWLYDAVSLTVTLNTGNSPEGTKVDLLPVPSQAEINRMDSTQLHFYLDESGIYTWDRFRKGAYGIVINKEGYDPIMRVVNIVNDTTLVYELEEMVEAPTNLYVSRTGWAMWDGLGEDGPELSDGNTRDFVEMEVMLTDLDGDTIFVGTTDKNYMQLPTEDLTGGELYVCSVAQVYTADTSAVVSQEWLYQPCDLFAGFAELAGSVNGEGVNLSWVYPETETVYLGAAIFRDEEWIDFTSGESFVDAEGTIEDEYELRLVYDGDRVCPGDNAYFAMSCPQPIELALQQYTIAVTVNPTGGGEVEGAGDYGYGATATLTAIPADDSNFLNWTEADSVVSTQATYSFTVTGNRNLVANFETSAITQSTHFVNGWTWWSTYVEQPEGNGLTQLEQGLGDNGLLIKSQTASISNIGGGEWYGTLAALDNALTYRVKTNAEKDVNITGPAVVTASHPVTLNPNWTWIGYPSTTSMTVAQVMAGITPMDGDMLKSQSGSATYMYGDWYGALALSPLTPGMGLMYKSNRSTSITLTFPSGAKGEEDSGFATEDNRHWKSDFGAYPDNMTVMAVVEMDGEELQGERYELAAFANGECRGSVPLLYIAPLNRYVAILTVAGDEAAELSFGLYDAETGEEYFDAEETATYQTNAVVGSVDELFTFHFRGATGLDEFSKLVNIFPNPVARGQRYNIGMAADKVGAMRVETVNAMGAVLSVETSTGTPAQLRAPETEGVYLLKITLDGQTCYRKLVVE